MSRKGRFWERASWAWTACLFYHIIVFYFSLIPSDRIPEILESLSDKLLHGAEFFVLFLLVRHALSWMPAAWRPQRSLAAVLWALTLGALIEILQMFIPGRSGEPADFWADAAGVALALVLLRFYGLRNSEK